jgi:ArsR family transcriptional regulator
MFMDNYMKFDRCKTKKSKSDLGQTVDFLKIISEENRLLILCLLKKGEMCVCEIWQHLNLPQNLVSHHLKVLKDFGLIKSRRESTKIIYSLDQKNIKKFISLMSHFIN